jgi:hypothetical protein
MPALTFSSAGNFLRSQSNGEQIMGKLLVLAGLVSAVGIAQGSWMKQVSGVGRGNSYERALQYAQQNLQGEIDDLVALCDQHTGKAETWKHPQPHCSQGPFNWQCTAVGKVTCRFQR